MMMTIKDLYEFHIFFTHHDLMKKELPVNKTIELFLDLLLIVFYNIVNKYL